MRARLTLATMAIMGAVLLVVVSLADFGARRALTGAVDGELERSGRRLSERPPGRGREGRPGEGPRGFRGGRPQNPGGPDALPPRFLLGGEVPYNAGDAARARMGETTIRTRILDGAAYRVLSRPIYEDRGRGGRVVGVLQIPAPFEESARSLDALRRVLLVVVLPLGVVLSGLASLGLVGLFMRPLRRIRAEAEAIGEADLGRRLPVVGEDEFAGLTVTLNGMLARIGAAFERERGELERQRRFTADASHELKTPLAVIKSHTGLLLHFGGSEEERRESLVEVDAAAGRMGRLVNDMLALARAEAQPAFAPLDLREAVREGAGREGVLLALPEAAVPVVGSRADLARVVTNLVTNARMHSGTDLPIEVSLTDAGVLTVRDHGRGITPEHLPHLFERFYRGDASRSSERGTESGGTGLGLAIVREIVLAHGGEVSVANEVGKGAAFTATLPLSAG